MGEPIGEEEVILKVSASRDHGYAKKVAGAMSWRLREHGYCKARAIKADAVNSAIKAVAIVNQRVQAAGVILGVDLMFAKADHDATAISMTVHEVPGDRPEEFLDYKVSGKIFEDDKSIINKLAGAIASPVREKKGVRLRCIGASAVYRAVLACTISRGFIFPNGLEAIIVPAWGTLESSFAEKPISLIQIEFWGVPLAES